MLPPAKMLATKNRFPITSSGRGSGAGFPHSDRGESYVYRGPAVIGWLICLVGLGWVLVGCTPPGVRAMLKGDRLLERGQYAQAVETLKLAAAHMPANPRAWNHLGLAYHHAGQPAQAEEAYRRAISLDRSNEVAVAHFNLGCLYLERNNIPAAADQLRSFSLLTNSVAGLTKLGTAQRLTGQWDQAERTYLAALQVDPRNLEALNGLGIVYAARNRSRDALQYFSASTRVQPKFAPAVLNAAIAQHQMSGNTPGVVQRYRDFLKMASRPETAAPIERLVTRLEAEHAPVRPLPSNQVAGITTTNLLAARPTNPPAIKTVPGSNTLAAVVLTQAPPRMPTPPAPTPPAPAVTNPIVRHPTPPPQTSAPPAFVTIPQTTNVTPTIPLPPPPPVTVVTAAPPPPLIAKAEPVEVTPAPATSNIATPEDWTSPPSRSEQLGMPRVPQKKPGFLDRVNPFRSRPEPPRTSVVVVAAVSTNAGAGTGRGSEQAMRQVPRYAYLAPVPAGGDRATAQRHYQAGLQAHNARQTRAALTAFLNATQLDPGWFEAQYYLGLAAFAVADWQRALRAFETALVINSDSVTARYNFALTLKQAGYPQDAANELERVLQAQPKNADAHLMLANLLAQELDNAPQARAHYQQVLTLDPRNPQAAAIRFWLAANPAP